MSFKDQINPARIPAHVAIIMDGNGRWARNQGKQRVFGHMNGVEAVRESLKGATEIGIKYLTLYAFSTENWERPAEEVDALMNLLVQTIVSEVEELDKNGVRLCAIGELDQLPEECHNALQKAIKKTAVNDRITLILALSYSSRTEITNAVKQMAADIKNDKLAPEAITPALISNYLATRDYPDPELLIRTSGENRISNFLLWQIAYSELYFTSTLWPDFKRENLYEAVVAYQNRERRFGKTSEQIIR